MSRATVLLSVLAAVLVAALWWLFLYSPGQDELARVEEEIAAAQAEQAALRAQVQRLESVREEAPEIEAAISRLRGLVPDAPALPGALRQIQAAADDAGVSFSSVATARPSVVDETIGLYGINLGITGSGSYFQIVDFLRRLEDPTITARGIEFSGVTVATEDYPQLTFTLTGSMYAALAPPPQPADPAAAPPPPPPADSSEDAGAEGDDQGSEQ